MFKVPPKIEEQLKKVEQIYDGPGLPMPIDGTIKLTVAALWAHGFTTYSSCGGHEERITDGPYINIQSASSPKIQEKIKSLKYGSDEFLQHTEQLENDNLLGRDELFALMEKFYKNHSTPFASRLMVERMAGHRSRLKCQAAEVMQLPQHSNERSQWLKDAQVEMQAFGEFLCKQPLL